MCVCVCLDTCASYVGVLPVKNVFMLSFAILMNWDIVSRVINAEMAQTSRTCHVAVFNN